MWVCALCYTGLGRGGVRGVPQPALPPGIQRFHASGRGVPVHGGQRQAAGQRGLPLRPHGQAEAITATPVLTPLASGPAATGICMVAL